MATQNDRRTGIVEDGKRHHDAQQRPPTIDTLNDEILLGGEIDLVGQGEEMGAARHQGEGEQDYRQELKCLNQESGHAVTAGDITRIPAVPECRVAERQHPLLPAEPGAGAKRCREMQDHVRTPRRDLMQQNLHSDDRSASGTAEPTVVPTNRARQGVTGHNVRYVLALGTAGVIAAFAIIFMFYF
jgi:hypothetical protein